MEQRDFVALDPVQADIREDFALSLGKTYVFKRGEMDPPPEAGCSVVEAATALACAHGDPRLVVRVKINSDTLWEQGSQGSYARLFSGPPPAQQIWRSVVLYRKVGAFLHASRDQRQGRATAIADHGDLLIAHIVFQHAGQGHLEDPEDDWDGFISGVSDMTAEVVARLVYRVDAEFSASSFVRSTFTNEERCRVLAERVLSDLEAGGPVPDQPTEYRPASRRRVRKPNAVPTLVDSGRLAEGTVLEFKPQGEPERQALAAWLAEDSRRVQATWVNERSKPLLWSADGRRYSTSGLVGHIWRLAEWESAPVAVQGPRRWFVPGNGSLTDLADRVLAEREAADE